jgi:uncharacterized protein (DUF305 family)
MKQAIAYLALAGTAALCLPANAHDGHMHNAVATAPRFVASTARPFAALMADAMTVMDYGIAHAPMNGQQEHDFATMMIPHHQGAIDMAKALLLTTQDPALRNMAQGIIAEQQIEIQLLQQWLKHHPATALARNAVKTAH